MRRMCCFDRGGDESARECGGIKDRAEMVELRWEILRVQDTWEERALESKANANISEAMAELSCVLQVQDISEEGPNLSFNDV
jgi:hypothetical protein